MWGAGAACEDLPERFPCPLGTKGRINIYPDGVQQVPGRNVHRPRAAAGKRPGIRPVHGVRAVTEIHPSAPSRSFSNRAAPLAPGLHGITPVKSTSAFKCDKKKNNKTRSNKSRRCVWETFGSATSFILRTRCAHILQETISHDFGIGKVRFVLCTCPARFLNL